MGRGFGPGTGKGARKIDNRHEAHEAKVRVRRNVLEALKAVGPVHVLDCFAGTGQLYEDVWKDADSYTGIDLKYQPFRGDERRMFACDNRRVLRVLDLQQFNLFDLDAYGSPWVQSLIIADRRRLEPGELIGFCQTDGSGITVSGNHLPIAVATLAELNPTFTGAIRWMETIAGRALAGMLKRMGGGDVVSRWEAVGRSGYRMRYRGVVMRGTEPEPQPKRGKAKPQEATAAS